MPQRSERSVHFEHSAPERVGPQRAAVPRFENRAAQFERPVRERFVKNRIPAPFVQRMHNDRDDNVAPFVTVVRPKRAHFETRENAFVAGRVVDQDDDDVSLVDAAGQTIVVRGWHGHHKHWHWANRNVTIPVIYQNGIYYAVGSPVVPAAFATFISPETNLVGPVVTYVPSYGYTTDYGYAPSYAYTPAYSYAPDYTNYAVANTVSSLISNVLGSNNSNSLVNSLLTNYLASYALGSLSGYQPAYTGNYIAPATYLPITSTASFVSPASYSSPLSYTYPTTCVYNDPNTGASYYDPSCAPAATTTYYTAPSAYAPAHVQGIVVGTSGSTLMVLGSNGMNPVLVNDAPALQTGLAFSGQPAVGRLINAYGFYDGNTFVATALQ